MENEYDNRISGKDVQNNKKALLVNQTLEDKKKDLFYTDISSQEIAGAIDSGAGMIGIISDFGGGKSTLSRYLAREGKYKLCNICLWSFYGLSGKDDMQNVSEMTHSFFLSDGENSRLSGSRASCK